MGEVPGDQVIDPAAFQAIVDMIGADEPSVIVDLIDTFFGDSVQQIKSMGSALAAGEFKTLHRAAHSMKSSSATFGAAHLSQLCMVLEQSAQANCENGLCADQLEQVVAEHQRVLVALENERERFAGILKNGVGLADPPRSVSHGRPTAVGQSSVASSLCWAMISWARLLGTGS